MPGQASAVVQFANFSEQVLIPENPTGNAQLLSVSLEVFPSGGITVLPSAPSGITINTSSTVDDIIINISGAYDEIAVNDIYQVVDIVNDVGTFRTFTNFNQLNVATYDHLFNFLPQNWSYATATYSFTVNVGISSYVTTMTQDIFPNMNRHAPRLVNLLLKERTA